MSDSANNNNVTFYIEQDAIIAGPQSVGYIGSAKMFDVAIAIRISAVQSCARPVF
jgi:hypothetical protein